MRKFYDAVVMMYQSACIFSTSVSTMVELDIMNTANAERVSKGESLAYGESSYHDLYVAHNDAIKTIIKNHN